ncbi:MAG: nicotinate (nicotinamide) nucleotide adenylyltransferase [Ruminococcaceae bacterium]|nr:nicotinate (nicotinamide) nucleotide adenylyltransferase [Oscillospiraceae bacterium]
MRIGIYGGSFSPPHLGHVRLAEEFLRVSELDRLIIVPAGNPPHKMIDGGADAKMRLEMCRAAFSELSDRVEISDFEAFRTDPCYTVDTLRHFSGEVELFMLCGSDMFLTLDRWREPAEIFSLCTVVCGARVDDPVVRSELISAEKAYSKRFGAKCIIMDIDPVEVSSTGLRRDLGMGIKPEGLCDGVFDIIEKYGLYGYKRNVDEN